MNCLVQLFSTCLTACLASHAVTFELWSHTKCGFRKGFHLEDHCLVLYTLIHKMKKRATITFLLFIDFQRAYNSIPRQHLWDTLLHALYIPMNLVAGLKLLYCVLYAMLSSDVQQMFPGIPITMGLKQGCPISPLFLVLFCDRVEQHISWCLE